MCTFKPFVIHSTVRFYITLFIESKNSDLFYLVLTVQL